MKPPKWNPIQTADYKGVPEWFGQFGLYLNNILQPIIQILNNKITIDDNFQFTEFSKTFTTDAGYSGGTFESFDFAIKFSPKLVFVCKNTSDGVPAPTGMGITYDYVKSQNKITVSYISGLNDSTEYDITLLVI
jgi:hypothetical protein